MATKDVGTLAPKQSQYLGGVLGTPLVMVRDGLREEILDAWLASESDEVPPADLDEHQSDLLKYVMAVADRWVELSDAAGDSVPFEDAILAVPDPFAPPLDTFKYLHEF